VGWGGQGAMERRLTDLVGVIQQNCLLFVDVSGPILTVSLECEIGDRCKGTEMDKLDEIEGTDAYGGERRDDEMCRERDAPMLTLKKWLESWSPMLIEMTE
jgi:hypothetical protein